MTWHEICKHIWYRCNELGISHRELARRAGLPEGSVCRWLNEKQIPSVDRADKMLNTANCDLLVGQRIDRKEWDEKVVPGAWIPVSSGMFPEVHETDKTAVSDYILLHFANVPVAAIGRYEEDGEGDAFYLDDEEKPCTAIGLIVDAWMYIPELEEDT